MRGSVQTEPSARSCRRHCATLPTSGPRRRGTCDDEHVGYSFDDGRTVSDQLCSSCGHACKLVKNFIFKDGDAYAVAFAVCHHHARTHEVWLDVIFGSWGDDPLEPNRVTFGARVTPVGAGAVDAAVPYSNSDLWGRKLTRDEALADARIGEFWSVLDFVMINDPDVCDHFYGEGATFE